MKLTQGFLKKLFEYKDGYLYWKIKYHLKSKIGSKAGFNKKGMYSYIKLNGINYPTHRLIYLYVHGVLPPELDHIDRDPSNNKIENLREATRQQNNCNHGISKCNKSGYKGVWWKEYAKKYEAYITVNKKRIYLGLFKDKHEAARIVDKKRKELHGAFASFNGVPDAKK